MPMKSGRASTRSSGALVVATSSSRSCSGSVPAGGGAAVQGAGTTVPGSGVPNVTLTPVKAFRRSSKAC
eukprot:9681342-Lingulodinium_polyedra.AAC.1